MEVHMDSSLEVRVRVPVGSENFCLISKISYISTFSAWLIRAPLFLKMSLSSIGNPYARLIPLIGRIAHRLITVFEIAKNNEIRFKTQFFPKSGSEKHFQDSGMRAIDSPHKITPR